MLTNKSPSTNDLIGYSDSQIMQHEVGGDNEQIKKLIPSFLFQAQSHHLPGQAQPRGARNGKFYFPQHKNARRSTQRRGKSLTYFRQSTHKSVSEPAPKQDLFLFRRKFYIN